MNILGRKSQILDDENYGERYVDFFLTPCIVNDM